MSGAVFSCRSARSTPARTRRRTSASIASTGAGTMDIAEFLGFCLAPLAAHPHRATRGLASPLHGRGDRAGDPAGGAQGWSAATSSAGDLCAIVTATNEFVTAPIARAFGVEHLIATRIERVDGRYHRPAARHTDLSRGQGAAHRAMAASRWAGAWTASSVLVLQRLEQRPAPAARASPTRSPPTPTNNWRRTRRERGWPVLRLFE